MKEQFKEYLNSINLSKIMVDSLEKKYQTLKAFQGIDEFDDIFLSETKLENGDRTYFDLCGFTKSTYSEISISDGQAAIFGIVNYISNMTTQSINLDTFNADENSKLTINIRRIDTSKSSTFSASGENCKQLISISKKYFIPNIVSNK